MTNDAQRRLPMPEIDKESDGLSPNLDNIPPQGDAVESVDKDANGLVSRLPAEEKPDEPPNGGYGWVCVFCAFWINAHTWGLNSVCSSGKMGSVASNTSLVLRRLSRPLSRQQYLPWRNVSGIRLYRWPLHFPSYVCLAHRHEHDASFRFKDYTACWCIL